MILLYPSLILYIISSLQFSGMPLSMQGIHQQGIVFISSLAIFLLPIILSVKTKNNIILNIAMANIAIRGLHIYINIGFDDRDIFSGEKLLYISTILMISWGFYFKFINNGKEIKSSNDPL